MSLDQFYTKEKVAQVCIDKAISVLQNLENRRWGSNGALSRIVESSKLTKQQLFFIEPSAGEGSFLKLLPKNRIGLDIEPRHTEVEKQDFLKVNKLTPLLHRLGFSASQTVVIGNPPFGKRGQAAINFFHKAVTMADTVAFIVPAVFSKYSIHKKLPVELQLVHATPLEADSFYMPNGRDYKINTEFQIWTKLPLRGLDNMRLQVHPPKAHEDFKLYQYNNTKEALKVFNKQFEFAVPCQGWQNYNRREIDVSKCEKNKQWMLFALPSPIGSHCKQVLNLLSNLDFAQLAHQNGTVVPGFRKHDIVRKYLNVREGRV